ncbi:MAG: hypothetical protein O4803_15675 [Trichodesmium sp. St15_bin1_1]|nr:hypothetical protein [Trichodesmium sp. St15_bin1_1]
MSLPRSPERLSLSLAPRSVSSPALSLSLAPRSVSSPALQSRISLPWLPLIKSPLSRPFIVSSPAKPYICFPFLETYDNLYKSLIICSIPASFWQRRRYPVHKLSRSN